MRIVVHVYIWQITTGNGFENLQILLVALLPTQFDQINLPYLAQMFAVTVNERNQRGGCMTLLLLLLLVLFALGDLQCMWVELLSKASVIVN